VELLLFFVMSFLCFTLLLYTGTPLSGTILHCPRGFSFSFSFLSLVKITAMSYSYLVLFFNLFSYLWGYARFVYDKRFINGVYWSTGIVLGFYVTVFGLFRCRLGSAYWTEFRICFDGSGVWHGIDEYRYDWKGLFFSLY